MASVRVHTLVVNFPSAQNVPQRELRSHPESSHSRSLVVDVDSRIYHSVYTDVFRGTCVTIDGSSISVALKLAYDRDPIDALVDEEEIYQNPLKVLQGSVVPFCYGIFVGPWIDDEDAACLVMEYCGESVELPFEELPASDKVSILTKLKQIHHQDLDLPDFVDTNGKYTLIDFHGALYHECHCHADLRPGDMEPDPIDFGCGALYQECQEMEIWDDGLVRFAGGSYVREPRFPRQEIIDRLMPKSFCGSKPKSTLRLRYYYIHVRKEMERGVSVEELEQSMENRFAETKV